MCLSWVQACWFSVTDHFNADNHFHSGSPWSAALRQACSLVTMPRLTTAMAQAWTYWTFGQGSGRQRVLRSVSAWWSGEDNEWQIHFCVLCCDMELWFLNVFFFLCIYFESCLNYNCLNMRTSVRCLFMFGNYSLRCLCMCGNCRSKCIFLRWELV